MAFNFFKKKDPEKAIPKETGDEGLLNLEQLDRIDGGYQKTQDDINKILSESDYIAEKKEELDKMLSAEEKPDEKGYSK